MYCKLHALVEPGLSPSLGKSFEWQHSKKKKTIKNNFKKITPGHLSKSVVQTGLCTSNYQFNLEESQVSYQIFISINKSCEEP